MMEKTACTARSGRMATSRKGILVMGWVSSLVDKGRGCDGVLRKFKWVGIRGAVEPMDQATRHALCGNKKLQRPARGEGSLYADGHDEG